MPIASMWPIASRITTSLAERVGVEQRALVVDHPRLLASRRSASGATSTACRHRRVPAGRDDHRVGREREHGVAVGVDADADVDAAARALVGAPVGERRRARRARAASPRAGSCRRARAARSSSVTSWPRAAATHAASSPAGPAADHDDPLARRGRRERPAPERRLAPDARVRDARDRIALREVAVATLVAAGARADLGGAARRAPC